VTFLSIKSPMFQLNKLQYNNHVSMFCSVIETETLTMKRMLLVEKQVTCIAVRLDILFLKMHLTRL